VESRKGMIAAATAVILACAAWLFYFYGSQPEPGDAIVALKPGACSLCGAKYAAEFGGEPAKCERCGQLGLWYALKCANPECRTVYPRVHDVNIMQADVACPKCGETKFREVQPDDLLQ